jgi:hypothetical protein
MTHRKLKLLSSSDRFSFGAIPLITKHLRMIIHISNEIVKNADQYCTGLKGFLDRK